MDFALPANHRGKLTECEKRDKFRDLARELKKLGNMKVTIISIVIGTLGTVTKGLLKQPKNMEITGRVKTSKLQHYWDRPEYWKESWRLGETCCHSNSCEKPSANASMKNLQLTLVWKTLKRKLLQIIIIMIIIRWRLCQLWLVHSVQ